MLATSFSLGKVELLSFDESYEAIFSVKDQWKPGEKKHRLIYC